MIDFSAIKVAALYMGLSIDDSNGQVVVRGPYQVIQPYIARLKRLGFWYNSSDQSWRQPFVSGKMTSEILMSKLFKGQATPNSGDLEATKKALQEFPGDLTAFQVRKYPDQLIISGDVYPLKDVFRSAGAMWDTYHNAYTLKAKDTTPQKVRLLGKSLADVSKEFQKHSETVAAYLKTWKSPGASLSIWGQDLRILLHPGFSTRIRSIFGSAQGTGYNWSVPLADVKLSDLDRFQETLETEFRGNLKIELERIRQREEDARNGIKVFHRTSKPYTMGEIFRAQDGSMWIVEHVLETRWMDAEDALSFGILMNRSGNVYYASARQAPSIEQ